MKWVLESSYHIPKGEREESASGRKEARAAEEGEGERERTRGLTFLLNLNPSETTMAMKASTEGIREVISATSKIPLEKNRNEGEKRGSVSRF